MAHAFLISPHSKAIPQLQGRGFFFEQVPGPENVIRMEAPAGTRRFLSISLAGGIFESVYSVPEHNLIFRVRLGDAVKFDKIEVEFKQ